MYIDKKQKKNLIEGCYHEIGHIIAAMILFPNDKRIKGISFSRKNNKCAYIFNTELDFHCEFLIEHIELCTMMYICGGVFQQMKTIHNKYKCILNKIPHKWLIFFFRIIVKTQIEGMEIDIDWLEKLHSIARKCGRINGELNLQKIKNDAINLLSPYIKNKGTDKLVSYIIDIIGRKANKENYIFIDFTIIMSYL